MLTLSEIVENARKQSGISNTTDVTSGEAKAAVYNERKGDLGEFDCPICKNKGYVAYPEGHGIKLVECECAAKRRSLKRIKRSGLSSLLNTYTFEKFETASEWQKEAKEKAMKYLTDGLGSWLVITGTPGTGKTHLCTAVCKELIDAGKDVRYMQWRQEAPRLKALVNDRESYEDQIYKLTHADALYIDDFFKGGVTEADINLAFEILNARYIQPNTQTILSSEKTVEELLEEDEAIGSRIYERSKGFCIETPDENWRLR